MKSSPGKTDLKKTMILQHSWLALHWTVAVHVISRGTCSIITFKQQQCILLLDWWQKRPFGALRSDVAVAPKAPYWRHFLPFSVFLWRRGTYD